MDEDSKKYTAFTVGSYGFYEFERMLFGLCNMPVTFQHVMQDCLRVKIDAINVSRFESHIESPHRTILYAHA